jgi:hypothetical protein
MNRRSERVVVVPRVHIGFIFDFVNEIPEFIGNFPNGVDKLVDGQGIAPSRASVMSKNADEKSDEIGGFMVRVLETRKSTKE